MAASDAPYAPLADGDDGLQALAGSLGMGAAPVAGSSDRSLLSDGKREKSKKKDKKKRKKRRKPGSTASEIVGSSRELSETSMGNVQREASSPEMMLPAGNRRSECRCWVWTLVIVLLGGVGTGVYFIITGLNSHKTPVTPPYHPPHGPTPDQCRLPENYFLFWNGLTESGDWYDQLDVNVGEGASFATNNNVSVQVDFGNHYAIQLFANPEFQRGLDDKIREWNPHAANRSGAIDECGWPLADPLMGNGVSRFREDCFYEDFSQGWVDSRITVSLTKGCCSQQPVLMTNNSLYPQDQKYNYEGNIGVEAMDVEYPQGNVVNKNVLRLTAINKDNPQTCTCVSPPCKDCHKVVVSNGVVQTRDVFTSTKFDVVAKVPKAAGLVWAMWTFHYEEHLPWPDCSDFGCYKDSYRGKDPDFKPPSTWGTCCGGIQGCCATGGPHDPRPANCPPVSECSCCDGIHETGPCPNPTLCDSSWGSDQQQCMGKHSSPDPQFPNNASINSWKVEINHEIDIEIPANCEGTTVCTETPDPSVNFTERERTKPGCINRLNTINMNNYIMTTDGGTGPAYSNMCAKATHKDGSDFQLVGDGKFHKYTIDWHTGGGTCKDGTKAEARVDFYVDDVYMGTNNVFVPTRASKLVIGSWYSAGTNGEATWNNWPDNWGGGTPGDQQFYLAHTYISEIRATPHPEPNDVVYPASYDQPDGCNPFYLGQGSCHRHWVTSDPVAPVNTNPGKGALATDVCTVSPHTTDDDGAEP